MNQTREKTKQLIENCRLICRNEPDKIENWLDLGRALLEDAQYDEAEQTLTKIFDEGRFFSFKNGIPRVRLKTLFHWKKNKLAYAKAYADLAFVSVHQANLAEAERLLSMALRVFEDMGEDAEYFRAANRLGTVYRLGAAFESAEELFLAARKIAEKRNYPKGVAESAGNLGMVCEACDRFDEALAYHAEALKLYESLNADFDAACEWRQLGLCFLRAGQTDKADAHLTQALALFEKTDDKVMQSRVMNDLTLTRTGKHALDTAFEALNRALASEDEFEIADNSLLYARLRLDESAEDSQIETLLLSALELFKKLKKQNEVANASSTLGLFYLRRRRWDDAESRFKDSLHLEQRLHRAFGIASDCCNLGLIAHNKGDKQRASEYWEKAAALFAENGDDEHAAELKQRIAAL